MTPAAHFDVSAIASKQDINSLKTEISQDMASLTREMASDIVAFKNDMDAKFLKVDLKFAQLEADIDVRFAKVDTRFSDMKFEIIKWVLGISAGQAALVVSLIKFVHV